MHRALRATREIAAGCVWVNDHIPIISELPHGGYKRSGFGKDMSRYSLDDYTQAGPSVPSNLVAGAAAGEFRHIIYDPNSGLIWYAVTDGSVASIDPVTHAAGPTLAANLFGADNPGAGRIITMSYEVLPEPATAAGALTALLTLAAIANRRRASGAGVPANALSGCTLYCACRRLTLSRSFGSNSCVRISA